MSLYWRLNSGYLQIIQNRKHYKFIMFYQLSILNCVYEINNFQKKKYIYKFVKLQVLMQLPRKGTQNYSTLKA